MQKAQSTYLRLSFHEINVNSKTSIVKEPAIKLVTFSRPDAKPSKKSTWGLTKTAYYEMKILRTTR